MSQNAFTWHRGYLTRNKSCYIHDSCVKLKKKMRVLLLMVLLKMNIIFQLINVFKIDIFQALPQHMFKNILKKIHNLEIYFI